MKSVGKISKLLHQLLMCENYSKEKGIYDFQNKHTILSQNTSFTNILINIYQVDLLEGRTLIKINEDLKKQQQIFKRIKNKLRISNNSLAIIKTLKQNLNSIITSNQDDINKLELKNYLQVNIAIQIIYYLSFIDIRIQEINGRKKCIRADFFG
ncbi:unnamed protein product [Paramecium octaurelia]|uniref:Uncharacterized protein n=1 Tax=Paramecium octaurelia TaxID=43137 RepID=A0A8S1Y292_PAROT|nr:unnamed protein product [Paramecium octaurelia]